LIINKLYIFHKNFECKSNVYFFNKIIKTKPKVKI